MHISMGKVIVLDEPHALEANQKLRVSIEAVVTAKTEGSEQAKRRLGRQRGTDFYLAPGWDEPLPDDIWEHNKDEQEPK